MLIYLYIFNRKHKNVTHIIWYLVYQVVVYKTIKTDNFKTFLILTWQIVFKSKVKFFR